MALTVARGGQTAIVDAALDEAAPSREDAIVVMQLAMQAGLPVVLWGDSGIGKTSVVRQLSALLGFKLWTIILALREPTDQNGLPRIDASGEFYRYVMPEWAHEVMQHERGVVFFDELTRAQPPIQNSALRIVHERVVGDTELPRGVSFIAACNRLGRQGTYPLVAALANRMLHVHWRRDPAAWCSGRRRGWPAPEAVVLPESWEEHMPLAAQLVTEFITVKPDLLEGEPNDRLAASQAWPSGRSWDMAITLLACCSAVGITTRSSTARAAVAAAIGVEATDELMTWIVRRDLPDPEGILAAPEKAPIPSQQGVLFATLESVVTAALSRENAERDEKKRTARCVAAWKYLGRVGKQARDLVVPAARSLAAGQSEATASAMPKEAAEVLKILRESGVSWGLNKGGR